MTDDNLGNQTPIQRVPKPWGEEIWWAHQPEYAGKILVVKKGKRLSLQYHKEKKESQYILKGKVKMTVGRDENNLREIILEGGEKLDIYPGTIHRIEALEDSEVFEVSTSQLEDVVRLQDDYSRPQEGNDFELDRKLSEGQGSDSSAAISPFDTPTE